MTSLDARPQPGVVFKHFTARDGASRWDALQVGARATSTVAVRLPDPMVDGGSESQGECGEAHRTHGEELYQPKDGELIVRPSPPRCTRGGDATTLNGSISPTPLDYLLKSPCGTVRPPLS